MDHDDGNRHGLQSASDILIRTVLDAQPSPAQILARTDAQRDFIQESCFGGQMTIAKFEVERFSLRSSKPFDAVVTALKSAVGQPDMVEFFKETRATESFPDLEGVVRRGLGRVDLMLFAEFDLGDILRRENGTGTPKIMRFVIGNPLIMKEMVKHVPDAGSYAPITVLIDERPDGVHISYDLMESILLSYGSSKALVVARDLDATITSLLHECAN
nr:DUF302 domain-containing protein [Methylobacterium oxalidis]